VATTCLGPIVLGNSIVGQLKYDAEREKLKSSTPITDAWAAAMREKYSSPDAMSRSVMNNWNTANGNDGYRHFSADPLTEEQVDKYGRSLPPQYVSSSDAVNRAMPSPTMSDISAPMEVLPQTTSTGAAGSGTGMQFLNGAASTLMNFFASPTTEEYQAWRAANPDAGIFMFDGHPQVNYRVDLANGSASREIVTGPSTLNQVWDTLSLGLRPVGNSLGTFFGGLSIASDEGLSLATRQQGAYDAGQNFLAPAEAGLLVAGGMGLRGGGGVADSEFGVLRARVEALGTDPVRGFIRAEGVGGVRIEQSLGRSITRSADEAVDFVDDMLGPISLKGPIPAKGSAQGLADAAVKDANFNTATNALFVDLRKLSSAQRDAVQSTVKSGTTNSTKQIFFLE
jgi:hypothetical protein